MIENYEKINLSPRSKESLEVLRDTIFLQSKFNVEDYSAWRMLFDDYSIEACSRKTNIWAFVVAGIIFAIAIAAFRFHKRRP